MQRLERDAWWGLVAIAVIVCLFDFGARAGGSHLVALGLMLLIILFAGFRQGARWAWWAMWILPAWSLGLSAMYVAAGVADGQLPPPPMVSGPIVAVLAGGILLVSAPQFRRGAAR